MVVFNIIYDKMKTSWPRWEDIFPQKKTQKIMCDFLGYKYNKTRRSLMRRCRIQHKDFSQYADVWDYIERIEKKTQKKA